MSQVADVQLDDQVRAAFRAELNLILAALNSGNIGTGLPNSAVNGTTWFKIVSGTQVEAYFYDGADSILLGIINPTANTFTPSVTAPSTFKAAINAATASGTNTYTATFSPAFTAYSSFVEYKVRFPNANTGSSTLNIDGIGAVNIKKNTPSGKVAIVAGDIVANHEVTLRYDGTDMILLNPASAGLNSGNTFTAPQKAATQALTSATSWDGSAATGKQHLTANVNGGTFTIANPSALLADTYYAIYVTYTTSNSIAFGSGFKGISNIAPTAAAGAKDHFFFRSDSTGTNLEFLSAAYNMGA